MKSTKGAANKSVFIIVISYYLLLVTEYSVTHKIMCTMGIILVKCYYFMVLFADTILSWNFLLVSRDIYFHAVGACLTLKY